jgi:hypothetical protein
MSRLVREEPDVLEAYITRVAAATSIPAAHISQALRQTVRHALVSQGLHIPRS